jgi:hypothetical protein
LLSFLKYNLYAKKTVMILPEILSGVAARRTVCVTGLLLLLTIASQYVSLCRGDTKAIAGKAFAGTASNFNASCQNFVSPVSIFAVQRGIVPACSKIENGRESEIPAVNQLIEVLNVKGEIFTLDALHC